MTMNEGREQELRARDRAHLDRCWQEEMARPDLSGSVPKRERGPSEGLMASFEKNPMLWTVVVLMMGGAMFFLVTRFLL